MKTINTGVSTPTVQEQLPLLEATTSPAMSVDLCEGLDGSGNPVWLVIVTSALRTEFVHQFNNKPEAVNWLKWCCQGMAQAVQS